MANARKFRDVRKREPYGVEVWDPKHELYEPSKAVQASKDECDINVIVNKYLAKGVDVPRVQVAYGDLSGLTNLHEALNQVMAAEEAFMALPAHVRKYFDNDPVKLVEFASDPKNMEKAVELGLATRRVDAPAPTPSPASPVGAGSAPKAPNPAAAGSEPNPT